MDFPTTHTQRADSFVNRNIPQHTPRQHSSIHAVAKDEPELSNDEVALRDVIRLHALRHVHHKLIVPRIRRPLDHSPRVIGVTRPRELGPPRHGVLRRRHLRRRQRLVQPVRLCGREDVVEFVGVADLAGTRLWVGCHGVSETDGEEDLVGVSWVGRVRLERGKVGRGTVDVIVCHQLTECEDGSGDFTLGRCGVIWIERRLVQDFLNVGAVKIEGELGDV